MFIQSCFIRENTPELINKLKNLGYDIEVNDSECIATSHITSKAIGISQNMFDDNNGNRTWNCSNRIDCGINDELFIALASLRDDTDKNQWFVLDEDYGELDYGILKKGEFHYCKEDKYTNYFPPCFKCHKATTEELIYYFDNRWSMYKLKHTPTGLYFQPLRGNYEYATNLSKNGKIYTTKVNALNGRYHIIISISKAQYENNKELFDRLGAYNSNKNGLAEYKLDCKCTDFQKEFIKTI